MSTSAVDIPFPDTDTLTLSEDQEKVMGKIEGWWREEDGDLTFGGLAGTGKTTIMSMVKQRLGIDIVAYCAPTGKATSVMRRKLAEHGTLGLDDTVQTLHQFLYVPSSEHCEACPVHRSTPRQSFPCHVRKGDDLCDCRTAWVPRESRGTYDEPWEPPDLIICDEASMVPPKVYDDLHALDIRILFVGDHGQLPPVRGSLNLMADPDVRLEKIHRQAADSMILKLAMQARESGVIPFRIFSPKVSKTHPSEMSIVWSEEDANDVDTLTLCYTNRTRVRENRRIRKQIGRPLERPVTGDRLICLRNNWDAGVYNGMLGQITKIKRAANRDDAWEVSIALVGEDRIYQGLISIEQFDSPTTLDGLPRSLDQWDYGYCMTVHKAQGSEAKTVYLIEERPFGRVTDDNWKRWLYTAVTRSSDELRIIKAGGR